MDSHVSDSPLVGTENADVPRMWANAVLRYEGLTETKLPRPGSIKTIPQLLEETLSANNRFKSYRHDGSKLAKLRTSVSRCLGPLQQLGNLVTQATKSVGAMHCK